MALRGSAGSSILDELKTSNAITKSSASAKASSRAIDVRLPIAQAQNTRVRGDCPRTRLSVGPLAFCVQKAGGDKKTQTQVQHSPPLPVAVGYAATATGELIQPTFGHPSLLTRLLLPGMPACLATLSNRATQESSINAVELPAGDKNHTWRIC